MAFKTDYKDAVTSERIYKITAKSSFASGQNYTIEDASTYTTEGDAIGAKQFNEFGREFNRISRQVDVTLPASNWSSSAPYSQKVAISGVLATDTPVLGYAINSNTAAATAKLYKKMTGYIDAAVTTNGYVTFYCMNKKPSSTFAVRLMGVSG